MAGHNGSSNAVTSGPNVDVSDNSSWYLDNVTSEPFDPYWSQLPFAHPYWKQFDIEHIPAKYHYAVGLWMTVFGIGGTLGNLLVIYIFIHTKHLRTCPNMLIVNLAVGDMTFAAVNGFPLLTIASINRIWTWGHIACQLYGWTGGIMGLMSINTLAFIAYERYQVISNPMEAAKNITKKKTFMKLVFIWFWSALWSTPPLFGWGRYLPEGFHTSCTYDYLTQDLNNITFFVGMYFFSWVCPVTVIVISYIGIVKAMFKHAEEMRKTADRMGATVGPADEKNAEIQIAKVCALTVLSFMLSWTPYAIVAILGMIYPHNAKIISPYMSEIPVMFAKASAAYNPLIYALSHPKYRAEVYKRFPLFMVCCEPGQIKKAAESRRKDGGSSVSGVTTQASMEMQTSVNPAGDGGQCT